MKIFFKILMTFIFIVFLLQLSVVKVYPGWFKHYGGTNVDGGGWTVVQQTSDGGYIVTGTTLSYTHGGYDIAIYKLNSNGNKTWFKHYGGTNQDWGNSIQQTSDGGYVLVGTTNSFTFGNYDIAIYKLYSSGEKDWFRHYGGTGYDNGKSIQQTSDGGYIVVGYTDSYTHGNKDFAIYKLNSSGNKIWFRHYGGSNGDWGESIQQTSDGGYVVAGYTESYTNGGKDFAIYKLNSSGNKIWFKHLGGISDEHGFSIQQTSDGRYIVAGDTYSFTYGNFDFAIYKLNSNGYKVWFKHFGGSSQDGAYAIQQTSDLGYVVAGKTYSYTYGYFDFAIYKLDSDGDKVWFKHYGGTEIDIAYSIQQTSDGGYIVAGSTESYTHGQSDFGVYKLDSNGDK